MKFDLKTPCKNCPFRTDATAIRFSCRERAEEIEESAYRNGFPCHLSAVIDEDDDDDEDAGYEAGENTQHCAGYIIMALNETLGSPWPGINNDEELYERLAMQTDMDAPVFESSEAFLKANEQGYGTKGSGDRE